MATLNPDNLILHDVMKCRSQTLFARFRYEMETAGDRTLLALRLHGTGTLAWKKWPEKIEIDCTDMKPYRFQPSTRCRVQLSQFRFCFNLRRFDIVFLPVRM